MSTKTNERRLKITPGNSTSVADSSVLGRYSVWAGDKPLATTTLRTDIPEEQAATNAALYADAHNTANEVDLLPSELLAKLREAERALDIAHRVMLYRDWNRYAEPSLQREAFEAANRIINPHHYTSTT